MALVKDSDLRETIMAALHLNAFIILTLEKFVTTGRVLSKKRAAKAHKEELEFDENGDIKEDRKHLLDYERPNHPIYPVFKNGSLMPAYPCAFCKELSSEE